MSNGSERKAGADERLVCHGLILAGGRSSRMGEDKALLSIDGRPLLGRLIDAMRASLTGDIVVAVNSPKRESFYRERLGPLPENVRFACDRLSDAGPLAGLAAGLSVLPGGCAYAVACDAPELSPLWLARLLGEAAAEPGALAVAAKGEPLHALYRVEAARLAEAALAEGDYRLMSLLSRARARLLELTEREKAAYGLHNLNTPEQWGMYLAGLRHRIEENNS